MCDGLILSDILDLQSHWAQDGLQSLNPNQGLHDGTMGIGLLNFDKVVILVSHLIANPHTCSTNLAKFSDTLLSINCGH